MSRPSVTCVMTAYNYARYVAGALESVLTQDYPPHLLDVVVVDDGQRTGRPTSSGASRPERTAASGLCAR